MHTTSETRAYVLSRQTAQRAAACSEPERTCQYQTREAQGLPLGPDFGPRPVVSTEIDHQGACFSGNCSMVATAPKSEMRIGSESSKGWQASKFQQQRAACFRVEHRFGCTGSLITRLHCLINRPPRSLRVLCSSHADSSQKVFALSPFLTSKFEYPIRSKSIFLGSHGTIVIVSELVQIDSRMGASLFRGELLYRPRSKRFLQRVLLSLVKFSQIQTRSRQGGL